MNYWSQIPIVRIVIPFALGIAIRANGGYFHEFYIFLGLSLLFIYWLLGIQLKLFNKHRFAFFSGLLMSLALVFLGMVLCHSRIVNLNVSHYSNFLESDCASKIEVISDVHSKAKSVKFYGEVEAIEGEKQWLETEGKVLVYLSKDSLSSQIETGDKLMVRKAPAQLNGPQNPHEFDYRQYLHNHNIYHQYYLTPQDYLVLPKGTKAPINTYFISARGWMLEKLHEFQIDGKEFAVISALVLGRKNDLDKELFESYSSAGAMHVLAVSGLHVGLIYIVLLKLFLFLDKIKHGKYLRAIVIILALWLYAGITGMSPSVMRAATMFTFIVIGKTLKRPSNIYNTLAASALLLLIVNPFLLMEVGFQLSYLAVLGIVYLQPKINGLIYSRLWVVEKIWEISSVSIAAQIATFPLGLLYFHQFPNYFLLSNLFVIPLATVILYTTFLFFVVSCFDPLAVVIAKFLSLIVKLLNGAISGMNSLPYNKIEGISITTLETLTLYFFIVMTIFIFTFKRMRFITLSLLSLLVLVSINTWEGIEQNSHQEILFHKISGKTAISISTGSTCHFFSSTQLFANADKMQFHVENHMDFLGIKKVLHHDIDSLENYQSGELMIENGFIKVGELKMLLLGSNFLKHSFEDSIEIDVLVVSNNVIYDLKDIDSSIKYTCLLGDSSNNSYCLSKLKLACAKNGIRFIDLREGAWLISNFENITDGLHNRHKTPI